ncbi:transglycosylase SLT domain-containing protein [Nocardia otitidiscaviarum]|uniref:lytic transglycosylase domain-containing protein n=1 Tax=Nocardia otitidiscaviarum TaxID=1823 RepID=UPI0004A733A7|nr:transglycosylase SLT domain-containing protein [Nocardia otitidiscaviarum]
MPDYSAGSASVEIKPDFRGFVRDLRNDLDKVEANLGVEIKADTAGFANELETYLQRVRADVEVAVKPDETSLNALEDKIRLKLAAMDLSVDVRVGADTRVAADEIALLRRLAGRRMTFDVDADTAAAAAQLEALRRRARGITIGGGSGGGGRGGGRFGFGALALGGAGVVAQLPAAATALATIGADLQAIVQAGTILPSIYLGAATAVGTLVVGLKGMKDALSDDPKKAAEAMGKLAEPAREVVTTIREFGPAWSEARKATQAALFEGQAAPIRDLIDSQLPALKTGMVDVAGSLNTSLKTAFTELGSDESRNALSRGFANTAAGIDAANGAIAPLISSIRTLTGTGSSLFPRFGAAITDASTRLDAFLTRADDSGDLLRWMNEGITATKEFVSIIGNLGSSLNSVFRAVKGDGDGFLTTVDRLTERMSEWLESTEGQTAMRTFFIEGREQMEKWQPILSNLGTALGSVYDGIQAWSAILMPFLSAAASLLANHGTLVTTAVTAWLAFRTLNPIIGAFRSGVSGATTRVNTFTTAMNAAVTGGASKFRGVIAGLGAMLGTGGIFGVALAGAAIGLGFLAMKHQEAKAAAQAQQAALEQLGSTLDKQTGKVTEQTIATAAEQLEKGGYLERAQSLGINTTDFTRASLGLDPAQKDAINQQLTQTILEQAPTKNTAWQRAVGAGLTDVEIAQALQGIPEAVEAYGRAKEKYDLPFDLSELKRLLNDVGESAATLGGEMNNLDSQTAKMGESARRTNEAIQGTHALTEQGKQSFEELGLAVQSVPDAKTVVVSSTTPEQIQQLKDLGYTVETLPDGSVKITLDDAAARAQIQQLTKPENKNITVTYTYNGRPIDQSQLAPPTQSPDSYARDETGRRMPGGRAMGGPITGGTPGKDSVPILAMPGEHMLTVSDVDRLGGQSGVYRFRAALQAGLVRPFKRGGAVEWTDEDETKLESAIVAVQQAEERLAKARNNPKKSEADIRQAELAVEKAQQKVENLQQKKETGTNTSLAPQAPLPERKSDQQISIENAQASVDQANTARNQIYADPDSTEAQKLKADNDYLSAQNQLESARKSKDSSGKDDGLPEEYSLQGIFSRAGSILAEGILGFFGLENSILSSNNTYNKAFNSIVDHYTDGESDESSTGGYDYEPQNLESTDTGDTDSSGGSTGSEQAEPSTVVYDPSSGVEQWRSTFAGVLRALEMPSGWLSLGLAQMRTESGGNPKAINLSDSNAAKGTPSKGLMQVIDPTFAAYRSTLYVNDIWDPEANIAAALRYTVGRYGSPEGVWGQGHGYRDGGWVNGIGGPRDDLNRAWLSNKEFVVNATDAAANADWLEAINSGARLSAAPLPVGVGGGASTSTVTHDRSVNFGNVQVMDVGELMRETDRWSAVQAQGALAAL